ncbi:hypothetical protein B0H66DRAFT_624076 [Apodospora peruviana]|uniref:Glucose-methanol-choline oxidoreductase N-terminal domain-containing protein n=1 Tax=Apodospora peruviana TaxID=516989 RepID=A0AAE0I691_9PEZI|nr:hypothetical protein B0H66DRAFT_624076 [Apodospora peruviana]
MCFVAFLHLFILCTLFPVAECLFLHPCNISDSILPSYDYIVVGGGVGGLVVANRLTEDRSVTVLVLEAGKLDFPANSVTVPGLVGHGWDPAYDWNISTIPQEFLDNSTIPLPLGHVVGGGTILNGLPTTRPGRRSANPGWGWRGLLPYFMKSETFVADMDSKVTRDFNIQTDMSVHGTNGPLEVTYPRFLYISNFLQGVSELGVPLLNDPNAGVMAGAMIVPSTMSVQSQSRADSRTAYLDGAISRPNLHLASEQTVTRILIGANGSAPGINVPLFGELRRAYGVQSVNCIMEVILAAGAILSPILLQVSGIGPALVLKELNISVQVDLPGVGQNLQDHAMVQPFYNYTNTCLFSAADIAGAILQEVEDEYFTNHTGPWTAPLISTTAFPSLRSLTANWSSILQSVSSCSAEQHLPPGQHPTILKGYDQQRQLLLQFLNWDDVGALEVMADSIGTLSVSNLHPFSRGTVRALSADVFASSDTVAADVEVDPRYCSQPEDCTILNTTAMQQLMPKPPAPWDKMAGPGPLNETVLLDAVQRNLRTEFHPCGTTSMMPFELGGVVNPRLVVYGTANLRVVDGGIMPLVPAAHVQAAVYAIAEKVCL